MEVQRTAALALFLILAGGVRPAAMAISADYVATWGTDVSMGRISTVSDVSRAAGPLAAFAVYARFGLVGATVLTGALLLLSLLVLARQYSKGAE